MKAMHIKLAISSEECLMSCSEGSSSQMLIGAAALVQTVAKNTEMTVEKVLEMLRDATELVTKEKIR